MKEAYTHILGWGEGGILYKGGEKEEYYTREGLKEEGMKGLFA